VFLVGADVANADTITLKVVALSGTAITATTIPTITVSKVAVVTRWWDSATAADLVRRNPVNSAVVVNAASLAEKPAAPSSLTSMPTSWWNSATAVDLKRRDTVNRSVIATAQSIAAMGAAATPTSTPAALAMAGGGNTVINERSVYYPTAAPVPVPAGMFLATQITQWQHQWSYELRRQKVALGAFSSEQAPIFIPTAAAAAVTLVDAPADLTKLRRLLFPQIDEARPILVPPQQSAGWTPAQFSDLAQRRAVKAQGDGFSAPPTIAPGEFLVSYVSQWHHQWDTFPRAKPKPFDASFAAPIGIAPGQFLVGHRHPVAPPMGDDAKGEAAQLRWFIRHAVEFLLGDRSVFCLAVAPSMGQHAAGEAEAV
jgi:hypothetical protein